MSRIESRPTKRSLGEYLFFIDLQADAQETSVQAALSELASHTEILKIFGSYRVLAIESPEVEQE
jgi:prephenate dehydratase